MFEFVIVVPPPVVPSLACKRRRKLLKSKLPKSIGQPNRIQWARRCLSVAAAAEALRSREPPLNANCGIWPRGVWRPYTGDPRVAKLLDQIDIFHHKESDLFRGFQMN